MRALLPAIALCAVLQVAAAPQTAEHTVTAMTTTGQGELHAQLVTPEDGITVSQHRNEQVVVASSLQQAPAQAQGSGPAEEHHPTTAAMLLAALALMTGIALRRWGAGQQ